MNQSDSLFQTIGFSDGVYASTHHHNHDRYADENINLLTFSRVNAIELNIRDSDSLDFLCSCDDDLYRNFDFVSLHASQFLFEEPGADRSLEKVRYSVEKFNIRNIVVHPDRIQDWERLASLTYGLPLSLENMDPQKDFGRYPIELKPIIDTYDFGLTLDLQHCFHHDESMKLADEFIQTFHDHIVEFHVSGYRKGFLHYPLSLTDQKIIPEHIFDTSIPVIIESHYLERSSAEKEVRYIAECVKNFSKEI